MKKHHGEIVECIVRKNGTSITGLARQAGVNRSKVYDWFSKKELNAEVIHRIGRIINHDFSSEFPEFFLKPQQKNIKFYHNISLNSLDSVELWKDKYIILLEKYKDLFS